MVLVTIVSIFALVHVDTGGADTFATQQHRRGRYGAGTCPTTGPRGCCDAEAYQSYGLPVTVTPPSTRSEHRSRTPYACLLTEVDNES
eukprot:m.145805 g.145805  ORF g.145805 m.145805 type:complete len:88 (+) comp17743_c0_seq2:1161-1424(+)